MFDMFTHIFLNSHVVFKIFNVSYYICLLSYNILFYRMDKSFYYINSKQINTNELRKVVSEDECITQEDIDDYMDSVKDYYVFDDKGNCKENTMSSKSKKVNLKSRERYLIYKALGSRIATMRNQIGYSRVDEDESLKNQINKAENLMEKIKNS